jgi:hypothetical protein
MPHFGHGVATGRCQTTNRQSGNLEHPKYARPRFERFSTSSPPQPSWGHGMPSVIYLMFLHSG